MTFKYFEIKVKELVTNNDYLTNSDKLKSINIQHYDVFLKLLLGGSNIKQSLNALKYIIELSIESFLSEDQIVGFLPKFRFIITLLDEKQ